MIRLKYTVQLGYEIIGHTSDFIFNIHAARTASQTLLSEQLSINQKVSFSIETDGVRHNRLLRLRAEPGLLLIKYQAEVDISHHIDQPEKIREVPIAQLPLSVLPYLYPSRYCESDKLLWLANQQFGQMPPGYARVEAIRSWVNQRTRFLSGVSNFNTSAVDTLHQQAGVCRDFAHLMIALCRALNIPARFCSGLDYGADPTLGPTDFHAYVEVFLSGRWYIFDPSGTAMPMGMVRIGTGRDAADVSFATIFGTINSETPVLSIEATADPTLGLVLPFHGALALCTDVPVAA